MTDDALKALEQLPPVVYLPATRQVTDVEDLEVVYRETQDGRLAVLVYTALDRFKAAQGDDHPWFLAPTQILTALHQGRPYDLLFVDLHVPEENRGPQDPSLVGQRGGR